MLTTTKELHGKPVLGLDGNLGRVHDFLFDDKNWVIRYIVTMTGTWLSNRLVLLSPHVLIKLDPKAEVIRVRLKRRQIECSPPLELHLPVSRRYEEEHYRYYGMPGYWAGSGLWGMSGYPQIVPPMGESENAKVHYHREDKHLQSSNSIGGFKVQTRDGLAGHVEALWVDDSNWEVHDLVVRAGHWYASKEILIATAKVERISYEDATVFVSVSKADIQWAAEEGRATVQRRASTPDFLPE